MKLGRADAADVPELRKLVNRAYAELGERGLNYTGVYQDEDETRRRFEEAAEVFLLREENGELIGTISVKLKTLDDGRVCAYLNQLAIDPTCKRRGLGTRLMDLAEARAAELGAACVRLDTAIPAQHLVGYYLKRGYEVVDTVQWEGKTYRSYILEKPVSAPLAPIS